MMKTGIAFSKTQFCTDTSKYAPIFKIARYNGRDFWEVARFVVRIMEMGDASYKQDVIYIASALVKGKANIYLKYINGTNKLDYFATENGNYYTFYVKATTNNSQVVAHVEYSNNIGFLQAVPYEYFNKTRPESYIAVDGQSHSGGTGGSGGSETPDIPTDPSLVHPAITLVQSDAWLNGAGQVFDDGGKNQYDVIKFTAVENTTYSYNYGNCINPAGSAIVFKLSYGNTSSLQKAEIPNNGLFTTPQDCVEVMMSIKHGSKDKLNMHIGTDIVTPDPEEPPTPPVTPDPDPDPDPDTPVYPEITLVQSDAWIDGTGKVTSDGGKNQYDVVKFTATGDTDYSYSYRDCINRAGSVIVFKLANGNTDSLQRDAIPNNGVFTTPSNCVEVVMSIKYGTIDSLNMRTGSYPSPAPEEPDPEPGPTPEEPTYPEITLVQSDAWLNGAGEVFDDNGKNDYDVVKFTATSNTTYSYNYADCINPKGSVIVFKFSYGNTDSIQKAEIPTNGQFTTPADCVEVMMSIKHGSEDNLNMHTVI